MGLGRNKYYECSKYINCFGLQNTGVIVNLFHEIQHDVQRRESSLKVGQSNHLGGSDLNFSSPTPP